MTLLEHNKTYQDVLHAQSYPSQNDSSAGDDSSKNYDETSASASDSNSKSGNSRSGTVEDDVNMIKEELTRHETTIVVRLRIVVIFVLVAVAAAVCYIIYDITHKAEIEAFETEFDGVAESIIKSLNGKCTDMKSKRFSDEIAIKKYLTSCRIYSCRDRRSYVGSRGSRRDHIDRS